VGVNHTAHHAQAEVTVGPAEEVRQPMRTGAGHLGLHAAGVDGDQVAVDDRV
jgi:hypothetical protein